MPIYALGELEPQIHETAFVHPDAVVIGDVRIGAGSSIWPCAVLRGDGGYISIGENTSIQDGSVLHTTPEDPTTVGSNCLVGHIVHLEGCTLEDGSFVGNGAIVLHRVIVRSGALVGANAVVNNDVEVPSGAMALGIPAKIRPDSVPDGMIELGVAAYIERAQFFRQNLRRLD